MALMAVACSGKPGPTANDSPPAQASVRGEADVHAVATQLAAVSMPCDVAKVAALWDREGFMQLVVKRAPAREPGLRTLELFYSSGANKFCVWFESAAAVRVVHTRLVDGEQRAVLRKVSGSGFNYYDVRASLTGNGPALLDVYSHHNDSWISQEIADALLLPGTEDPNLALTVARVNALDKEGKHVEALAALDTLPEAPRNTRAMQDLRVAIAGRASREAHVRAMQERARRFPDHKPTPSVAMNQAFLAGDLDEVLRQVDLIDAAVGGDPFLDAIRAAMLVQRNAPGDLDAASTRAQRAVEGEPTLPMIHTVVVTVAMARREWANAVAALDALEATLGITPTEQELASLPNATALFATPEYRAWRQRHP